MEWPGGVLGFVDPADTTKLIGLQVTDRQFRTEKGIGVCNSMGAALLSYGLAPRSIDLPSGIKLLAYDDVGIAFGIATTDPKSPDRARVGTVDRVMVFATGSGWKIFVGL